MRKNSIEVDNPFKKAARVVMRDSSIKLYGVRKSIIL